MVPPASQAAGLAEGLKEVVQENLRLSLFIAGDVLPAPRDKLLKFFPARHGRLLHETTKAGKRLRQGKPAGKRKEAGHYSGLNKNNTL
jgi:hypothetical protein